MITTARLILRRLVADDAERIYAMSQEAGVRRWLPDQVYDDVAHAARVIAALPETIYGVERAGELIGHVGLSPWRDGLEVGYAIEDRHQGRGYATEAVAAVARPGTYGVVRDDNLASIRVLEKAGFQRAFTEPGRIVYRCVG